jgi:hypothetical protein
MLRIEDARLSPGVMAARTARPPVLPIHRQSHMASDERDEFPDARSRAGAPVDEHVERAYAGTRAVNAAESDTQPNNVWMTLSEAS